MGCGWIRENKMTDRLGLTTCLVVVALVVATVPAGALPAATTDASTAAQNGSNTSNATFGASVSAFMQASAANAEGEVDDRMFSARFENASAERRADLVRGRAAALEQRLDRLRAERAELLNTTDGEAPSVADRAKAARLTARINALENAIATTDEAADRAGVNVTRLDELRRNASELTGREVAELSRGLAGVGQGPPGAGEDRGNRGNGRDGGGGAAAADGNTTDDSDSSGPETGRQNGGNGPPDGAGNGPEDGRDDSDDGETEQ